VTSFTSWCRARFFSRSKQLARVAGLADDSVLMHSRHFLITVLLFVLGSFIAEAQHPWQRPVLRDRAEVERIMGEAKQKEPSRELRIIWVWDFDKNHAPGFHEYVKARVLFSGLLKRVPKVSVEAALQFPSQQQWAKADLVAFYLQMQPMTPAQFAMMDAYLKRGGGMVAIHGAFIQGPVGGEVAKRFGLAWAGGRTQWGVLPIPSTVAAKRAHGIFDRFPEKFTLVDEHYWGLGGKVDELTVLATAPAGPVRASKGTPKPGQLDNKKWPLFWTKEIGKGRVFGSIPGHNLFTFNDPYYRIILLRAMAWAMNESFDPFKPLVTHNALIKNAEGKAGNEGVDKKFPSLGDAHRTDKSYTLVWQDEFTGNKLDRKKWVAVDDAKIGQYGHGNGESQTYLDAEGDTFFVKDGRLTLVAHHAPEAK